MDEEVYIHIAIGNTDDKLSQARWAQFMREMRGIVEANASHIYGIWFSEPQSEYQNACYSFVIPKSERDALLANVIEMRTYFKQESVAWTEGEVSFV